MPETETDYEPKTPASEAPLTPPEQDRFQDWVNFHNLLGKPIDRREIEYKVRSGDIAPTDVNATLAARRLAAASGMTTVDFPVKKDLTALEKVMLRLNRDAVLEATNPEEGKEGYDKPPGEVVEFREWKEKDWVEYGWSREDKRDAKNKFMEVFAEDDPITAERATEALLLAGYTASDVIGKLNAEGLIFDPGEQMRMEFFRIVFSDDRHTIHAGTAKIVFPEEARHLEEQRYGGRDPSNMEEIAWRLIETGARGGPIGKWMQIKNNGERNKYAMFEARADSEMGRDGIRRFKEGGKYYVNEPNFLYWFRDELEVLWDVWGPNTPIQPMTQIQSRKSNLDLLRLQELIEKPEAFKSEDGKTKYDQMWLKLQLETGAFQILYDNDIIYRRSAAVGLEKWLEQYEEITILNPLTKLGFRTNVIQQLLIGTNAYREGRADVDGSKYLSDNKFGGAFAEMVLAFYNLGDFDAMEKVLGKDSSFFTYDGWHKAMTAIAKSHGERPGGESQFLADEKAAFEKAFDKQTGKIITAEQKKNFIKFINKTNISRIPSPYLELSVIRAIRDSVVERFNLENTPGLDLVVAEAWFFNRSMGGNARNDISMTHYKDKKGRDFYVPNPSTHDKPSEFYNLQSNRKKYNAPGGGKPVGVKGSIEGFVGSALDPMSGIFTMQEVPVMDAYGNPVIKDGKVQMTQKSILMVLTEAHDFQVRQEKFIQSMREQLDVHPDKETDEYKRLKAAIDEDEKTLRRRYMHFVAQNAAFQDNIHAEYTQVHLKPAAELTKRIMTGEGLDFENFTGYDAWGGPTIKRGAFIQDVQKKLIAPVRDLVKKYHWMDFNEDARVPFYDEKNGEHGFRDGKLGERMFGHEMLDRKEFWMTDKKGKPIKVNGLHVIDFGKVDKDREQLMKQMIMYELAADMRNHQLLNTGDKRFPYVYYVNMIETLVKMLPKGFLSKEDLAWFLPRALNGNVLGIPMRKFGFYFKWAFNSLFDKTDKEGLGFGRSLSVLVKAISSGY